MQHLGCLPMTIRQVKAYARVQVTATAGEYLLLQRTLISGSLVASVAVVSKCVCPFLCLSSGAEGLPTLLLHGRFDTNSPSTRLSRRLSPVPSRRRKVNCLAGFGLRCRMLRSAGLQYNYCHPGKDRDLTGKERDLTTHLRRRYKVFIISTN